MRVGISCIRFIYIFCYVTVSMVMFSVLILNVFTVWCIMQSYFQISNRSWFVVVFVVKFFLPFIKFWYFCCCKDLKIFNDPLKHLQCHIDNHHVKYMHFSEQIMWLLISHLGDDKYICIYKQTRLYIHVLVFIWV